MLLPLKADLMKHVNINRLFSTDEEKETSGRKLMNWSFVTDTRACVCTGT